MKKYLVSFSLLAVGLIYTAVVNAGDDDVIDLSSNSVDSFKSAIGQHDAILVEFCEYSLDCLEE